MSSMPQAPIPGQQPMPGHAPAGQAYPPPQPLQPQQLRPGPMAPGGPAPVPDAPPGLQQPAAAPVPGIDPQVHAMCEAFRRDYRAVYAEIGKAIVGHGEIIDGVLTCLFVGGHALLEGVPGLGKTALIRTLASALNLSFNRIQFTPDLMPADIIGTKGITETPHGSRHAPTSLP